MGGASLYPPTLSLEVDAKLSGRRFVLVRAEDESGVSGTGMVSTGIQFPDGTCAIRWNTATASTGIYASIKDVEAIHGHEGKTVVNWID